MNPRSNSRFLRALFLLASVATTLAADRVPWTTSRVRGTPDAPPLAAVERVFPALGFKEPTDFLHDPTTRRWFVSELSGRLVSFPSTGDATKSDLAFDLSKRHQPFSQLLGFTFDPAFESNRFVYVAWVSVGEGAGRENGSHVSRLRLSRTEPPVAEEGDETEVLTWLGGGHNGSCLKFGPDGCLYISTGDGSSPEPPDALRTGQNLDDLLSCILRIDVRKAEGARAYTIPRDNPFVGRAGARGEIWAYGFRNPWRMAFGPEGDLWVGDVGWELWETVHRVRAGYNGGWSRMEGPQVVNGDLDPPTPVSEPVMAHPHSEAASITGGCFYEGAALAAARGAYVYGDWATGKLWALRATNGAPAAVRELATTTLQPVAFATGPDRELYVLDHQQSAGIHRLVPARDTFDPSLFPRKLSQTGLFADVREQRPAPGVEPYDVVSPVWHDGASSRRWIAVPGTEPIRKGENWTFPAGTVAVKTIGHTNLAAPVPRWTPIETQLLHYDGAKWRAYAYHWDHAGRDAELVGAKGATSDLEGSGPELGGADTWRFGSRTDCLRCHNSWSGFVLGINPLQLGSEAARLGKLGVLAAGPGNPPSIPFANPQGHDGDIALRARSWLHANCAPCHRWGAGGAVPVYFPIEDPLEKLRIADIRPSRGDFGLDDARLLAPGHPERSVLWLRMNTSGAGHMPMAGPRRPDPNGSRLVADWIRSMRPGDPTHANTKAGIGSPSGALALLDATLPGKPGAAELDAALHSTNAVVRDLFASFAPGSARKGVLGDGFDPGRVLKLRGDPARGLEVMRRDGGPNCLGCHRLGAEGRAFGPELSGVGRKYDDARLLGEIVEPSRTVAPENALHVLELADGSTLAGLVSPADGGRLRVRDASGQDRVLGRADIRKDERQTLSAMPEGLLSNLTAREAADILAAIRQAK